jgi:pyruvate kinase
MRRAKIVATLGPASSEPAVLEKLLGLGLDVARLNFSHGRHEEHAQMLDRIRAASRHLGKAVAVLQDLQGPKIRTGPLKACTKILIPDSDIWMILPWPCWRHRTKTAFSGTFRWETCGIPTTYPSTRPISAG